jgi:glycosyltransferase involved in cell wall biosynthesis
VRRIYAEAGLTGKRAEVVYNLPPPGGAPADAAALRRRFGLNDKFVLFVGRWSLGKGAEEMSAAWPLVRAARPTAQLVVIGRRETEARPRPEDGVVFTGPLAHDETLALIGAADVFALPSRWPEPYARTALEAMAAAKPIVATNAGGNAEQVIDGVTGFLAPRGDVRGFADRLAQLLGDPALARQLGEAGQARLDGELSGARQLERLTAIYEETRTARARELRVCAPVLSLAEDGTQGGGVFHVKNLQALADRGVSLLLPLAFRTEYAPRRNWDVRVIPIRRTYKLGALLSNFIFFAAILWLRFVRGERFDVLRVGDLYHFGPAGWLAAKICGVPAVGMVHHIDQERRLENAVVGFTARRLEGVLAPSRATVEDVIATFDADPLRLHQITEGATLAAGEPPTRAAAREKWSLGTAPVVGFLGALQERKNVGFLLTAFAGLARQRPAARLLVVGDGPLRGALAQQARALGIEKSVIFAGRLFDADKAAAFQAMDVFAFPSLNEGFGLAVVEAMVAGVAVVVSDRGSLPEVVRHDETGLVAPTTDPAIWAATLARLLDDEPKRAQLAKAGRDFALANYTWDASAAQCETAFRRVLAEPDECRLGVLLNSGDSLAMMRREGQEERFVGHYLRRYAAAFDQVCVFSYGDDRARPYPNAAFAPGRPRWKGLAYAALLPFVQRRRLRGLRLLRAMQIGGALPAVLARVLYGLPFVATYGYRYGDFMRVNGRPLYGWWMDRLEGVALRCADKVIVTTPALAAHVARRTALDKIVMLPNGVDLSHFPFQPRRPAAGKRTALFVGRLTVQKNLPLLIAALAPLRDRVRLVCVGGGEDADLLRRLAGEAGVELSLPGVARHRDLPQWHAQADLFLLPSVIEGHPKALLEAMASGLPCVGAAAPGVRDVLVHGVDGLLAAPTAEAMTAAVRRLLDDDALAADLGRRAREHAVADFDLDRLLDREIELLRNVAKEKGRCRAS